MSFLSKFKFKISTLVLILGGSTLSDLAHGRGAFEYSLGFNYNRSNYSETSYSWTRRWGTSFGYHFTPYSGIELSLHDSFERTKIDGFQDTSTHDRIYSINWVQNVLKKGHFIQPYFKIGLGQLNRDVTGSYFDGAVVPASKVDSVTIVLSLGFKVFFTRRFALRTEATTYLEGGSVRTWKDNLAASIGGSIFF